MRVVARTEATDEPQARCCQHSDDEKAKTASALDSSWIPAGPKLPNYFTTEATQCTPHHPGSPTAPLKQQDQRSSLKITTIPLKSTHTALHFTRSRRPVRLARRPAFRQRSIAAPASGCSLSRPEPVFFIVVQRGWTLCHAPSANVVRGCVSSARRNMLKAEALQSATKHASFKVSCAWQFVGELDAPLRIWPAEDAAPWRVQR